MTRTVVDGMNVIGARADGWWRDRDGAARRLLGRLQRAVSRTHDAVTLVLDGRPPPELAEGDHGGVDVRYARRRGRNAADDRIVELVAADADPAGLRVVTSDRELAARVVALGATTEGAGTFLRRLDRLGA
ncbi:MAG TPA: NYN domain-containing protein [Acidimicrobiia bacterium]|nr:NYN domain-containing protein [Acidimicrobiia bacterium]